jgi:hypothetical protein
MHAAAIAITELAVARNRKFESISLQQTVRVSPEFAFLRREAGIFRGYREPGRAELPD